MKYLLSIALILLASFAWADNTGEKSPTSSAQEASPTTAWTNIDSVFASDDQRASYTGTTSDSLYITNLSMGVPADATIDSIFVTTEAQGSATQAARRRLKGCLTKDGTTIVGETVTFNHDQDSDTQTRLTGGTNPLWDTTWTAAEVNASTFGFITWKTATQAGTILIDHVTIYVAYTLAGGAEETEGIIHDIGGLKPIHDIGGIKMVHAI